MRTTMKWVTGIIDEPTILNDYTRGEPSVNWSAAGSVSVKEARQFAQRVIETCDHLENDDE
jgi:hypothetical protein